MSPSRTFPHKHLFHGWIGLTSGLILKVRAFPFHESLWCVIGLRYTAKINKVTVKYGSLVWSPSRGGMIFPARGLAGRLLQTHADYFKPAEVPWSLAALSEKPSKELFFQGGVDCVKNAKQKGSHVYDVPVKMLEWKLVGYKAARSLWTSFSPIPSIL